MTDMPDSEYMMTAHRHCFRNRREIECSVICGCFYCLSIFSPALIDDWLDEYSGCSDGTALCPYCGIDSVIGSSSGLNITKEFLLSMQSYWF